MEQTKEYFWNKASGYCARAEHCEQDVRLKLLQWGCNDEEWKEEIIGRLLEDNFMNEGRYCSAFVHDQLMAGKGKQYIRNGLRMKGLPVDKIEAALLAVDEDDYERVIDKAIEKAKKKYSNEERQMYYLYTKGFDYNEIRNRLRCNDDLV